MSDPTDPVSEDVLAAMRAGGDQMRAGAVELADTLVAFRNRLVLGGIGSGLADEMARDWLGLLLDSASPNV